MSNFLLRDPDCILIHIPKTGGSSIRRGVWQSRYDGPAFGEIPADWPQVFRFAFVRHPLERFVSAYADFTQIRGYKGDMETFAAITMDDSIAYGEERSGRQERIRHHTIPQTHPFNCLHLADEIYRYEDYANEVSRLAARTGVAFGELAHRRKTDHAGWEAQIPDALRAPLIAFYAEDFTRLGYPLP
ncbi:sulfotransferase family 2 domain-containing protein [Pseudooceanicola nanhaiensis]|uniref:sulfotransferase family 2 domain-containing protein n=1 Tax=Pseudooceanicola nanhaiensis TaxID=375761 RepID=UPI001CD3D863|nr:sulfotransferase family 2 domain-containing protein [Pseudooceanicola nanhaiensis]MCA0921584.1 sulfotransferase family protein [Pseudooceanicola nanhaiensis]